MNLIFAHKLFFFDLTDDWAGKMRPDILKFVPYTWKISVILKEFELITLANEGNWIDCTSKESDANTQLAICGDDFELSFNLPFDQFVPLTVPIKLWIQGQSLDASIHIPKSNLNREIIEFLDSHSRVTTNDYHSNGGHSIKPIDLFPHAETRWRRFSKRSKALFLVGPCQ